MVPSTASATTYTVRPGDTLWQIASDLLGDGADWTSLATLNLGRDLGGGSHFVDPDQLKEGWRLRLPADARRSTDHRGRGGDGNGDGRRKRRTRHISRTSSRAGCAGPGLRRLRRLGPSGQAPAQAGLPVQRRSAFPTGAVRGGAGYGDAAAALCRGPSPRVVRSRQLLLGLVPGGSVAPTEGSSDLRVDDGCHVLLRRRGNRRSSPGFYPRKRRHGVARRARRPPEPRPLLSAAARRLSRGRRRRGDLARAARAGGRAAPPGRGRTGSLARRPCGRRIVGLVGDRAGHRGSRRPRAARRDAGRSLHRPARALLWRPGCTAFGSRGTVRGGDAGARGRQQPDRAGRSSCRNPPSHGARRPPSPPVARNGPTHCRPDRAVALSRSANPGRVGTTRDTRASRPSPTTDRTTDQTMPCRPEQSTSDCSP